MKQALNNRIFQISILFLVFLELLSIFAWGLPEFNTIAFFVIVVLTLILSLKKLSYGIYIAVAELVIGSHGYLFALNLNAGELLMSVRMGIFGAVMLAWLVNVLRQGGFGRYYIKLKDFEFFRYYIYLAIVLLWGFVWGVIRGNNFGNLFLDFNNWLFFLYLLPLIGVYKEKSFWRDLVPVVSAALFWLIAKTLILLYIFSHQFIWALPEVYQWVRDTRVGEITAFSNNFYRIFIQSQIYCLLGFFGVLPLFLTDRKKRKWLGYLLVGCLVVVIISFSRSFWLGLVGGALVYAFLVIFYFKLNFKRIAQQIGILTVVVCVCAGLIFVVINLPPKISGESLGSLLAKRTTQIEAAGNSRINMLKPLGEGITKHPVIGSGFGTTVTYRSVDPRILTTTAGASGEYTTYAFEWAYLDLILKVGLFGLFVYLLLIFKILQKLWSNVRFPVFLGMLSAVLCLLVVNVFTPYLNHPLGIGVMLIISVFVSQDYG